MRRGTSILLAGAGVLGWALAQENSPKTIIELQPFRTTSSSPLKTKAGREGLGTLVNLNPAINSWYLLQVAWKNGASETVHLENTKPREARVSLDPAGLVIVEGKARYVCDLFGGALEQGRASPVAYFPLCEGRLYLRNAVKGRRTALEATVEYLRDQVWGGEKVIEVFHHVLEDRYRETGVLQSASGAEAKYAATDERPVAAVIDPRFANQRLMAWGLGVALVPDEPQKKGMAPGAWYTAANPGMWVSVIQPNFVAPSILQSYKNFVSALDGTEASSLCYLIAFDLDQYDLEYALGTEHPEVGWSPRAKAQVRNPQWPGPDGIGRKTPLVSTGLIRPDKGRRTVAAFVGGFKRTHGAFSSGDLSLRNYASHYGFIESGVVYSKLQPGLATSIRAR